MSATTGRQIETIESLRSELGLKNETPVEAYTDSRQASAEISRLFSLKNNPAAQAAREENARVEASIQQHRAETADREDPQRAMCVKMFGEKSRYSRPERQAASAALAAQED